MKEPSETGIWQRADGSECLIARMSNGHLMNAIALIKREGFQCWAGYEAKLEELEAEALKRGFVVYGAEDNDYASYLSERSDAEAVARLPYAIARGMVVAAGFHELQEASLNCLMNKCAVRVTCCGHPAKSHRYAMNVMGDCIPCDLWVYNHDGKYRLVKIPADLK